jgi:ankyrin repeat protein
LAAQSGFSKGFDLLLKHGASTDILDKWGRSPGDVAKESFLGRQEAIRKPVTVQAKTNLSKMMEFPLDETRFVQLCAESSDLDGCDYFGLTALHKLASWDKPNCMHLLFSRISDPARYVNAVDADGNTAAHLCASEICFKILVENGVDLSKKNKRGEVAMWK